jgi:hypothetical protein
MFDVARGNAEWLKENFDAIKKEYDNHWVIIEDKRIIKSASTFDEVMEIVRKHDPNKVLVEYIESKPIAMFF